MAPRLFLSALFEHALSALWIMAHCFALAAAAHGAEPSAAAFNLQYPMPDTGGHVQNVRALAFTPDGKQLVSGSEDGAIRFWDLETGKRRASSAGETGPDEVGRIYAMALSKDGKWLAVGGAMGAYSLDGPRENFEAHKIRLYDFATGKLLALLKGHKGNVVSLAFSPDGQRLLLGKQR